MKFSAQKSFLRFTSLFLLACLTSVLAQEELGIEEVPELDAGLDSESTADDSGSNELALLDPNSVPEVFTQNRFPGFNEIYLADPLTLPKNFLVGYDPKEPRAHLDDVWKQKYGELFHASRFLMRQKNLADAIHTVRQGLLISPDDPQGRNLLGNCYNQLGLYPEAIAEYSRILEHFPDFIPARVNRAKILLIVAYQITQKNEQAALPEAQLVEKQNYLLESIKDAEFLIDFLVRSIRENPTNQVQFEKSAHLLNFQIYLCQLGLGDLQGAARNLSRYSPQDTVPTWYFMKAASALKQAQEEATEDSESQQEAANQVQSARNIYSTQDNLDYLNLLQDINWL